METTTSTEASIEGNLLGTFRVRSLYVTNLNIIYDINIIVLQYNGILANYSAGFYT